MSISTLQLGTHRGISARSVTALNTPRHLVLAALLSLSVSTGCLFTFHAGQHQSLCTAGIAQTAPTAGSSGFGTYGIATPTQCPGQ